MKKDAPELDRFADRYCLDLIAKAVESYITVNYDKLEFRSWVKQPEGATLEDCRIEFTTNVKTYGKAIGFDAIVSTDIEIFETVRGTDKSDSVSEWFRVPCQVLFEEKLERFRVHGDIEVYDGVRRVSNGLASTSRLVPIIYGEDYDAEANKFLEKYCPEALETPMPVPLEKIAEAMGLPPIIYDKHLSRDFSVFGKICFADDEITVYNAQGVPETITTARGQIFIAPDTSELNNAGYKRNTIAHELFHWVRHRLYATIRRLLNLTESKSTLCRIQAHSGTIGGKMQLTDEEWMERHANSISPRIVMPTVTAKPKAMLLLSDYGYQTDGENSEQILCAVIAELADFYEVSNQLATVRLIQFGFEQAREIFDADNERNISYSSQITPTDIIKEYAENEDFRKVVDSGLFRYAEGRFIINNPKYISKADSGGYTLTDYARVHLDECALRFETVRTEIPAEKYYSGALYDSGFNRKKNQNYATLKKYVEDAVKLETAEAWAKASAAFKSEAAYHKKLIAAVGAGTNFSESFNALMKAIFDDMEVPEHKRGARFFDITGIPTKVYYDMLNGQPDYCPKDRTIVAICVAFDLDVSICEKLFQAGGRVLRHTDEHIAFRSILTAYRGYNISERNDRLEALGFGRLTDDK